jgi:hypothetical protein
MDPLSAWWVHEVKVERLTGTGAYGDKFAAGVTYLGFVEDKVQQVRDTNGNEVTSTGTVAFPTSVADIPPGSRLTLRAGTASQRVARVITFARAEAGPLPTPNHLELTLT